MCDSSRLTLCSRAIELSPGFSEGHHMHAHVLQQTSRRSPGGDAVFLPIAEPTGGRAESGVIGAAGEGWARFGKPIALDGRLVVVAVVKAAFNNGMIESRIWSVA
jgi:hypothetical protein